MGNGKGRPLGRPAGSAIEHMILKPRHLGAAAEEAVPADEVAVEHRETKKPWTYSQARFMGKF